MKKFARIIDFPDESQMLLTIDYNQEDETHQLTMRCDFDELSMKMGLDFQEEESAQEAMENFTQEQAMLFKTEMENYVLKNLLG